MQPRGNLRRAKKVKTQRKGGVIIGVERTCKKPVYTGLVGEFTTKRRKSDPRRLIRRRGRVLKEGGRSQAENAKSMRCVHAAALCLGKTPEGGGGGGGRANSE